MVLCMLAAAVKFIALNTDGAVIWSVKLGMSGFGAGLTIGSDGTVYIGDDGGYLHAVNSNGGVLADTQWPKQGKNLRNNNSSE